MRWWVTLFGVTLFAPMAAAADQGWDDCVKAKGDVAIAGCTAVLEREPLEKPRSRAIALYNRGLQYSGRGDLDRAIADYSAAVETDATYPSGYNARGYLRGRKGDAAGALADYTKAIELNPRFETALVNRGNAYFDAKDYDRAVADYSDVIRLNPTKALNFANRGHAYLRKGDPDRALKDFEEAIRVDPSYARSFLLRGVLFSQRGDFDRAIADYSKAAEIDPKYALAFTNRATRFFARKDWDRAIADYGEAIRLEPTDATHYGARALTFMRKGDAARALTDYEQAIGLQPANARYRNERGNIFLYRKDYDRALADFSEAIKADPSNWASLTNRGDAYKRKGDIDRALADFDAAIGLEPKYTRALALRADTLAGRGDLGRAVADYDAMLSFEPGNKKAQADREEVARKLAVVLGRGVPPVGPVQTAVVVPAAPKLPPPSGPVSGVALKKTALVIGNGAYVSVANLANPTRDAEAMAKLFRNAGFATVQVETNLTAAAMRKALRTFSTSAANADIAVVFFAGHAIEVSGQNYLLPIDAVLEKDLDVQDEAISLDRILDLLTSVTRLKFVIIDACRNNPFQSRMQMTVASRAVDRGLARPNATTSNTLIAYAAKAGSTASDGKGQNSPFTTALLKRLTQPGTDIRIALGEVHDDVMSATGNAQEPFLYGALGGSTLPLGPVR